MYTISLLNALLLVGVASACSIIVGYHMAARTYENWLEYHPEIYAEPSEEDTLDWQDNQQDVKDVPAMKAGTKEPAA